MDDFDTMVAKVRRQKTFDPACLDLAESFLSDVPSLADRASELAAEIQQVVEDWIDDNRLPETSCDVCDAQNVEVTFRKVSGMETWACEKCTEKQP